MSSQQLPFLNLLGEVLCQEIRFLQSEVKKITDTNCKLIMRPLLHERLSRYTTRRYITEKVRLAALQAFMLRVYRHFALQIAEALRSMRDQRVF